MDLQNLSSNWKALQKKLSQEKHQVPKKQAPNGHSHQPPAKPNALKRKASIGPATYRPRKYVTKESHPPAKHMPSTKSATDGPTPTPPRPQARKFVALDTEQIGISNPTAYTLPPTPSSPAEYSLLARISLVTFTLDTLYDAFVAPTPGVQIVNYRTPHSGITPAILRHGEGATQVKPFEVVQNEVARLLEGRIVIGHAVERDLRVCGLEDVVPRSRRRDTARHGPFRTLAGSAQRSRREGGAVQATNLLAARANDADGSSAADGSQRGEKIKMKTPSLKFLAEQVLGWEIQRDEKKGHSSVEDARATMALFRAEKVGFEREAGRRFGRGAAAVSRVQSGASDSVVGVDAVQMVDREDEGGSEEKDDMDEEADVDADDIVVDGPMRSKAKRKKKKKKGRKR